MFWLVDCAEKILQDPRRKVKYTYLLINVLSVIIPIAFSFESKVCFYKRWKALAPAMLIPAVFFIIWDSIFTELGVWGFNPDYLTGIYIFNLPIEEILFFFAIPYCCVFSYDVLNHFIKKDVLGKNARHLGMILIYVCIALAITYSGRSYTATTSVFVALFLLFQLMYVKPAYWSRLVLTYLIILIPFFIVNGVLTGTGLDAPVVWYNDKENLGVRLLTIPIEDTLYGFLLIASNISLYEYFQRRLKLK
jgi:lycopene cyclase domain-containing protein